MTSRQILESIRQDARRHQMASQETNIFYYDTNYNSDSDLESNARDKSESPENVNKLHTISGNNNYFTSIVNNTYENVNNNTTLTNKSSEEQQTAQLCKVNNDFDTHHYNYNNNNNKDCSYAGSSTPTEGENVALRMSNVESYTNVNHILDDDCKSPYKTNTHVYKDGNTHMKDMTSANTQEDVLHEVRTLEPEVERAKGTISNNTTSAAALSAATSPSSSPSMSVLLDITPIKANIHNDSNLSSDHTACPARRSSSSKVTVPMLALSTVHKLNYADNLQLNAQYIKSLTSSPMAMKTTSPSAPRDHAQIICTPDRAEKSNNNDNNKLKTNNSNNNNNNVVYAKEITIEEKPDSTFNNTSSYNKNKQNKDEESNRMMLLLKLEDDRCSSLENNQMVDSPINLVRAKRTEVNSPSYHIDNATEHNHNNNNNNNNLVLTSLNSLSANRSDSISRIENSLALLQVELAKEKRHSIEAEQRAYALQREMEKYKSENCSLNAALEALKSGNSILSEAISPRKPRDVTEMDVVSINPSEWMAQWHLLNEQVHELQKTISRQETELASKEERIRLLEHKLADQLLSGMLPNQTYTTSSSSAFNITNNNNNNNNNNNSNYKNNKNDTTTSVEVQRETSHFPKQIVHSVMLNKTNMASTKLANTISSNNSNINPKSKMIDANMTLKPSEIDINDLHVQHRDICNNNNNNSSDNNITKMTKDHKDLNHRVCDDNNTSHNLLSSTLGDSHKLKTSKHPSDTVVSQRSVKTALTNTNTNTSNTQTSINLNTGRTNRSNFSNGSIPDVLAHTRTTVQRLSTCDNETDKSQEIISPMKNTHQENNNIEKENTMESMAEQNVSSVNNSFNEMKATITKPLPEGTNNVTEVIEHPQHVEKTRKNEPASARLVLPSPHTRSYENKHHVHGMTHTSEDDNNNKSISKNDTKETEMKFKTKSARVKHPTIDGNIVSSRRKAHKLMNNNSKSVGELTLDSNIVPFTVSARVRNNGKDNKKRTATSSIGNTAPISSVIISEQSEEHKKVIDGPSQEMPNTQSKEDDQEQRHNINLRSVNTQESIKSEHLFIDTSQKNESKGNSNNSSAIINNVLHKKSTKPPPLTEDALRHKEMPSMASLNSALVLHVNSKIHTSSMDTMFNSTQEKNIHSTINEHDYEDMVNLEVEDEEGNANKMEKYIYVQKTSNEVQVNNNIFANKKTNTPRRAVQSPLRSSMSNIMTKPSPRISQRNGVVSGSGIGGGACTPRKANEITAKSTQEQTPSSTRSSKPNVATASTTTWTRNAMTPISRPTNKTLLDNSHGYKPQQRTGMFALSHFAPTTHQPSSLMNKKMQSMNMNNDSSNNISNNNQESDSVNIKQIKTPLRKEENDKEGKQPQSARRPVSTPRLTFRQAITPHATRPRDSSINNNRNNNKQSVLIECEEGKVKDVFGISVEEPQENKMRQVGMCQPTELMTPLTVHTESMKLPEYAPEHSSTTATAIDNNAPIETTRVNEIDISKNNIRHAKTPNEHSKRVASPRYNTSTPRYANTPTRRGTFHAETPNRNNRMITNNNKDVVNDKQQTNKFSHSKMEHSMSLLHKETPASEMLSYGSALLTLSAQRRAIVNNSNITMKDHNKEHKGDLHSGRNANENASTARSRSNATVRRSMMNLNTSKTRPRILYTGKDHETAVMKGTTTTVTFRSPAPTLTESSRNTTELPMSESECHVDHDVNVNNIENKGSSTHRSSSRHTHSDKLRSSSPTRVMSSSSNTARGFNLYSSHDATATAMRIINDPEGMEDDSGEGEEREVEEENNEKVKVESVGSVEDKAQKHVF